jgi:hypothetical protein
MPKLIRMFNQGHSATAERAATVLAVALFFGATVRGQVPAERPAAAAPTPILVELFTAEGCSSCPPADALLERMIATQPTPGVAIVGLGEHVDYWNQLGWRDRFSSAEFTARQQAYVDNFDVENAYTPQMVVDGTVAFVGSDVQAARRALEQAAAVRHAKVSIDHSQPADRELEIVVTVSALQAPPQDDRADIIVAITEDGLRSDVKRGENAGKVLVHTAVVRSMKDIGQLNGAEGRARTRLKVSPEWRREQLKIVAFAQSRKSRRVLGTAVVRPYADPGSASGR